MSSEVPSEYPTYFNCDAVSERCPVEATLFGDYFNKGACLFFAITYANLLAAQSYLGWRLKSKLFVFTLACGTIAELMGYIARVVMVSNPWNFPAFIVQNTGLTLAPTMIAIANSVTFKHLVLYYGERWSFIKAKNYPLVFVGSDGMCLGVQSVGGVLAATATGTQNQTLSNIGNNLMLAGICLQVVNMIFCGGLILSYAWRRRFSRMDLVADGSAHGSTSVLGEGTSPMYDKSTKTERRRARIFVYSLVVAYLAIVIRCAYRFVATTQCYYRVSVHI